MMQFNVEICKSKIVFVVFTHLLPLYMQVQ